MNRPFCASNKQLEQKWRDMAYQRHKEKLRAIKPKIQQEMSKNREEENYKIQRRLIRVMGEERRQQIIAKENQQLLVRILNIMASPSRLDSWNTSYITESNARRDKMKPPGTKKVNKDENNEDEVNKDENLDPKVPENTTQLPPLHG